MRAFHGLLRTQLIGLGLRKAVEKRAQVLRAAVQGTTDVQGVFVVDGQLCRRDIRLLDDLYLDLRRRQCARLGGLPDGRLGPMRRGDMRR